MPHAWMSESARAGSSKHRPTALLPGGVLAGWLALVVVLGERGSFQGAPGAPPLPMLLGAALPLLAYAGAWRVPAFRAYALAADLRIIVAVQGWRVVGFGFLALWAFGILPGMFAWPAGLGDMVVGLTAPWILAALLRRPGFAASRVFMVWNLFGILDLLTALALGGISAFLATGAAGTVSTRPMADLPLLLIPAYLVPLILMLEITVLLQLRAATRTHEDH